MTYSPQALGVTGHVYKQCFSRAGAHMPPMAPVNYGLMLHRHEIWTPKSLILLGPWVSGADGVALRVALCLVSWCIGG